VKWPRRGQISVTPGERSEPGVVELPEIVGLEEAAHKPFVFGLFEAEKSLPKPFPQARFARLGLLTCSLFEAFQLAKTYLLVEKSET